MKNLGFTLAEVLITLAVIGVVAAITLPTLVVDTTTAQIGPKLAKAVAMFEQANETLLNENSVDTLSDAGLTTIANYLAQLPRHLKCTVGANHTLFTKDGMSYNLNINNANPTNTFEPAHMQNIGTVSIDINGEARPNAQGIDVFQFSWWNDGSLRPRGGTNWNGMISSTPDGETHWRTHCPVNAVPTDYSFCTGHIFENNFKVLYR